MICLQHLWICSFPLSVQRDFMTWHLNALFIYTVYSRNWSGLAGVYVNNVTEVFNEIFLEIRKFPVKCHFQTTLELSHSQSCISINIIEFLYFYWLFTIQLLVHRECVYSTLIQLHCRELLLVAIWSATFFVNKYHLCISLCTDQLFVPRKVGRRVSASHKSRDQNKRAWRRS